MADGTVRVRVTGEARGLARTAQTARQAVRSIGRDVQRMTINTAAAAAAVTGLTVALGRLAQRGGEVLAVQRAFNRATEAETQAVERLQQASGRLLSRYDLMVGFNRANALGAAETVEQYSQLTRTAITLGRALGEDAQRSLDSLTIGIGRQSRMILDNLGIMVNAEAANLRYAEAIGVTASQLTEAQRREAFRTEALRQANALAERLGGTQRNAADAWAQVVATARDQRDAFAGMVAESEGVTSFLEAVRDLLGDIGDNAQGSISAIDGMALALAGVVSRLDDVYRIAQRIGNLPIFPLGNLIQGFVQGQAARAGLLGAAQPLAGPGAPNIGGRPAPLGAPQGRVTPRGDSAAFAVSGQTFYLDRSATPADFSMMPRGAFQDRGLFDAGMIDRYADSTRELFRNLSLGLDRSGEAATAAMEGVDSMAASVVDSFGFMTEAVILSTTDMAQAVVRTVQGLFNQLRGPGGLLSAINPILGAGIGAGLGILGAFLGTRRNEPVPVRLAPESVDDLTRAQDDRPQAVSIQIVTPSGDMLDEIHTEIRRRERRDAVLRLPRGVSFG